MPAIRYFAIGMLALLLSGCGQLVSEKLTVSQSASTSECPISKRLVILPLADYSYVDQADVALKRNVAIMENLTDELVSNGFQMPIREDLLKYLAANKIIKVKAYDSDNGKTRHIEKELNSNWSSLMKDEIAKVISEVQNSNTTGSFAGTNALDLKTLSKIANDFNVGYVMRGRIVKFQLEEDNTWNPLRKGILPIIIGGTDRTLFGVARSDSYDVLNQMAVGGVYGAVANRTYANSINAAPSVTSNQAALAGAAIGLLSSQSGRTNQATIQLRLWVQSPESGDVIWTNRVEVKVKPQTMFADTNPENLYTIAVERAVASLVEDFVSKTKDTL